jgi:hypothetical protein
VSCNCLTEEPLFFYLVSHLSNVLNLISIGSLPYSPVMLVYGGIFLFIFFQTIKWAAFEFYRALTYPSDVGIQ